VRPKICLVVQPHLHLHLHLQPAPSNRPASAVPHQMRTHLFSPASRVVAFLSLLAHHETNHYHPYALSLTYSSFIRLVFLDGASTCCCWARCGRSPSSYTTSYSGRHCQTSSAATTPAPGLGSTHRLPARCTRPAQPLRMVQNAIRFHTFSRILVNGLLSPFLRPRLFQDYPT
jgi:hypothetical protein